MIAKDIIWTEEKYGFFSGTVDGIRLFGYGWDAARPHGSSSATSNNYKLTPALPGMRGWHCKTPEKCQEVAARELNLYLQRLIKEDAPVQQATEEERPVRLDRKTRGQVRRVVNKLKTVESREFPSSSNPSRMYRAVIYQDGQVLCNCQGWTMKKEGKARQCKHTAELINGRDIIDNDEYQFLAALVKGKADA